MIVGAAVVLPPPEVRQNSGRQCNCHPNMGCAAEGYQTGPHIEAENVGMTAFVLEQMDYIFFVLGLSFFLVSAICFYIASIRNAPPGWLWLGAFGALHGTKQWLHLGALSLGDDAYCHWLRLGILFLSFLCLCGFVQRAARSLPRFLKRLWLYPPLLAVAAAGAAYGPDGLDVTIRYALGFPGCLGTAFVLARLARDSHRQARQWLTGAAACFAIYALTVGLIVPRAPFFPATYLNQLSFLHLVGLPIYCFRAVLGFAVAVCLWHYMLACRPVPADTPRTRWSSPYLRLLAAGIVVLIVAGWLMTNAVGKHATQIARVDDASAVLARARPHVQQFVGLPHHLGIVLYYQHRVAEIA